MRTLENQQTKPMYTQMKENDVLYSPQRFVSPLVQVPKGMYLKSVIEQSCSPAQLSYEHLEMGHSLVQVGIIVT